MGSILTLFTNAGILISFIAGNYLSYSNVSIALLIIPIAFFVLYAFFPESPLYLIQKRRLEDGKKALRFYRNVTERSGGGTNEHINKEYLMLLRMCDQRACSITADTGIYLKDFGKQ